MATTWIKPIRKNKGKTVAQTIKDRTDYAKNPEKTEAGQLVTGYACDARTVDIEFLLTKQEYERTTGRERGKDDILLYHVRQSFKPDEIDAEKANQIGHELALKFTKSNHAFIVSTHIDKAHIHNHIIFNAVSLNSTQKFRNPIRSNKIIRRISDHLCLENGLSIIENPKPPKGNYRDWQGNKEFVKLPTARQKLERLIDEILTKQPQDFNEFVKLLEDAGCEFKQSRRSVRLAGQKGFIRLNSLSENYKEDAIKDRISSFGTNPRQHEFTESDNERSRQASNENYIFELVNAPDTVHSALVQMLHSTGSKKSATPKPKVNLLIDIQNSIKAQSSAGYEQWAKVHNLKESAKTLLFLQDNDLTDVDKLNEQAQLAKDDFNDIKNRIKSIDLRLTEISTLQKHIGTYIKTKDAYAQYKKLGFNKSFYTKNQTAIENHKEAKQFFDAQGMSKLPTIKTLKEEFATLSTEKKKLYSKYNDARKFMQDILKAKQNVEQILNQPLADQLEQSKLNKANDRS